MDESRKQALIAPCFLSRFTRNAVFCRQIINRRNIQCSGICTGHRSEELYLKEIDRFVNEIAGPPAPADFVVFRFGRTYSHGGIVIDWPIIIHAYIPHGVLLSDALRDGELLGRQHRFFELAVSNHQPALSRTPIYMPAGVMANIIRLSRIQGRSGLIQATELR